MYNPLLGDITKLKDNEIDTKISEISKKYHIAARMGHGGVCDQLASALSMYKEEQYRRQVEATQKLAKKQDKDFDDLINVD